MACPVVISNIPLFSPTQQPTHHRQFRQHLPNTHHRSHSHLPRKTGNRVSIPPPPLVKPSAATADPRTQKPTRERQTLVSNPCPDGRTDRDAPPARGHAVDAGGTRLGGTWPRLCSRLGCGRFDGPVTGGGSVQAACMLPVPPHGGLLGYGWQRWSPSRWRGRRPIGILRIFYTIFVKSLHASPALGM
jgi:hypothetical protein